MSKFANLKTRSTPDPSPVKAPEVPRERVSPIAPSRLNKKPISGYFSEALHKELATLAVKEGTKVQPLLGEALDLLFHSRGLHTFGER